VRKDMELRENHFITKIAVFIELFLVSCFKVEISLTELELEVIIVLNQ
jgi:hypothetical protein